MPELSAPLQRMRLLMLSGWSDRQIACEMGLDRDAVKRCLAQLQRLLAISTQQ